jgi:hypothetical protein
MDIVLDALVPGMLVIPAVMIVVPIPLARLDDASDRKEHHAKNETAFSDALYLSHGCTCSAHWWSLETM